MQALSSLITFVLFFELLRSERVVKLVELICTWIGLEFLVARTEL